MANPAQKATTKLSAKSNAAQPSMGNQPANQNDADTQEFCVNDHVVYPQHGVGQVTDVETTTIAGMDVTLYTINFEKDRMRLKLPIQKAKAAGLRKLTTEDRFKDVLETIKGRARVKKTMWSRRAQEYETKINSGDPISIAEVLRDLKRPEDDTEQSYSERQIYQSALDRLARELAAIKNIDEDKAAADLQKVIFKAA